jgi:NAD(P)-dependent dehydrogenase (short-subunit alcohol dehydrogenase family)
MAKVATLAELISLRGKTAMVTGAASGIGKAIARRLGEAGANLELVDIDPKALARTRTQLLSLGVQVDTYEVDLSKKSEIDGLWNRIGGKAPDILVNNAGIYPFSDFCDADEAFCRRVMEINLFAVNWMCQHMISQRRKLGGAIINVSSIEAVQPFKEDAVHYSVSKAGVSALTRALAKENARHGFRITAVVPGGILTRGTGNVAKEVLRGRWDLVREGVQFSQRLPARRLGQADEVARMVLVLASDLASYVYGAAIPVDGGFLTT